mgnify:FL=1|tara:strand:+ start:942 stop:1181 length:240 start_codon:yes stop_codon:yes gene_type:complete
MIGQIKIAEGLMLTNPTMESQGIKAMYENIEETGTPLGFYLEVHFQGEGENIKHSRSYAANEDTNEVDFIKSHDLLSQF